jgi:phenylpropionate dioxygenase-like ring-hydroxylating dioxygenase large terminal subunit
MIMTTQFLRNVWYVAAWAKDLDRGSLISRTVVGEPLAIFRNELGSVGALEDRCGHRGVPFTVGGTCRGDVIQCPYHGFEYAASGECMRIPGQDHIPAAAAIRSYPVVEQDLLIWVWMGDPALADRRQIPSHPYHTDPAWKWTWNELTIKVEWRLLIDNLFDLSHLGFVHRSTIGGDDSDSHMNAGIATRREGDRVYMTRNLTNSVPSPFYAAMTDWSGTIDRWQEVDFVPGLLHIYSGAVDAGEGGTEGSIRSGGVQFHHMHAVTPVDEGTTRYFFSLARSFRLEDDALTQKMDRILRATLDEDVVILEAQQLRYAADPARALLNSRGDAAGVLSRRMVSDLHDAEQKAAAVLA